MCHLIPCLLRYFVDTFSIDTIQYFSEEYHGHLYLYLCSWHFCVELNVAKIPQIC